MGVHAGRALSLAAVLVGQHVGFVHAAPTCARVASQWAVVFSAECTQWFEYRGRNRGDAPESCTQDFTGAVAVEDFPWNDAVVVVDNEAPGESISLQPEEDVVQYGAGIVIMQTSWDMDNERMWQPRTSTSAERVYAEVEYIASDESNYLDFDLSVHYEPENSRDSSETRKLSGVPNPEIDEADLEEFIEEVLNVPPVAEDANGKDNTYHPTYFYSYEQESYDFNYGFELEDLDSYSYDFVDSMFEEGGDYPMHSYSFSFSFGYDDYSYNLEAGAEAELIPPNAVQSVTSMDIYVCTDEENDLAELRFNCNPDNNGTAQCFAEAGDANVEALEIHGMNMICDKICLDGEADGLWCDIFGLNGCRLCTNDCTSICDGELACSSCILCDGLPTAPTPAATVAPSASNGPGRPEATSPPLSPSAAPSIRPPSGTDSPRGLETPIPTALATPSPTTEDGRLPRGSIAPTPTGSETPSPAATLAPTVADGARGLDTAMPTVLESTTVLSAAPTAAPSSAPTTAGPSSSDGGGLPLNTASPTAVTLAPSGTDGSREPETAMPASGETASPTSAPTIEDGSMPLGSVAPTSAASETPSPTIKQDGPSTPTPGPTGYETPSPTTTDRGLPSASPTTGSRGGFEFETASPTSGLGSPSPTPGSTGYDTPSPTSTDRGFPFPSASPTAGSRGGFGTASPTSESRGGIPMMSAAPTSSFSECIPGDPETCYDQLNPYMRGRLEILNRRLTCEESCLVTGGLWCNALGLNGCRFCATSCDDYCSGHGLPDDCECFEC